MTGDGERTRLRIDPVACDGIGLCGHLAPGAVELDRWGYPIVTVRDLNSREVSAAKRAVQACPRNALWIETAEAAVPRRSSGVTARST